MRSLLRGTGVAALALLASACGGPPPATPDPQLLAHYDTGTLTVADLDEFLLTLPSADRQPKESAGTTAWLDDRLEALFERRVLTAAVAAAGDAGDEAAAVAWKRRAQSLLATEWLRRNNVQLEVTAEEARAYFEAHRSEVSAPERRSFRNLLLAADPAATDPCHAAEELRRQALAGASFEQLVMEHSQSANARLGGLVAPVARRQLRKEVGDLVFELDPGEVSPVLSNRAGCQLFQLVQVVPAIEPDFSLLRDGLLRRLADEKRAAVYRRYLEQEAAKAKVKLPAWLFKRAPADLAADAVLCEVDGEPLLVREVAAEHGGSVTAADAQARIGDLLFAAAERREQPAAAEAHLAAARPAFLLELARLREVQRYVRELPEETLRAFYEERKPSYQSDPRVELTVLSWPIRAGDPLDSLARPQEFLAALATHRGDLAAAWAPFAADLGARREELAEVSVRQLARQRPELSMLLAGDLAEGSVLGPARSGRRLWVFRVNVFVPARQLGFVEVRDRLRADYLGDRGLAEWRQRLRREHGFQLVDANVRAFGDTLLAKLKAGATNQP